MNKICLKCGYVRKDTDTAPEYECPKCGVVYAKAKAAKSSTNTNQRKVNRSYSNSDDSGFSLHRFFKPALALATIGLIWFYVGKEKPKNTGAEPDNSISQTSKNENDVSHSSDKKNSCQFYRHYTIKSGQTKTISLEYPFFNTFTVSDPGIKLSEWSHEVIPISYDGKRISLDNKSDYSWDVRPKYFSTEPFTYNAWVIKKSGEPNPSTISYSETQQCEIVGNINKIGLIRLPTPSRSLYPVNVVGNFSKNDVVKNLKQCISPKRYPILYSNIDNIRKVEMKGTIVKINLSIYLKKNIDHISGIELRIINKKDKSEYPKPIGPYSIVITSEQTNNHLDLTAPAFSAECGNQSVPYIHR